MIAVEPFSPEHRELLLDVAAETELMHVALEFHGFAHPMQETLPAARYLALAALKQGVQLEVVATDLTAITHDAFFHVPLEGSGYVTKELRTADVVAGMLERRQLAKPLIDIVQGSIVSTHVEEPYILPEDAVDGYADVINTAGPYEDMLQKTYNLWIETQRLQNAFIDPGAWLDNSIRILTMYAQKTLPKALEDVHPFKLLQARMFMNIECLKRETPESFLAKVMPLTRRQSETTSLVAA